MPLYKETKPNTEEDIVFTAGNSYVSFQLTLP